MAYTTINKSGDYFNTVLYTGNGSTNNITGVGFQPDWTWIKNRTDVSNHNLYDAVRGTSAGKLKSNDSPAESYNASDLSSFNTDGFTVGGNNEVNGSGDNMVSWNWLGSNTTAANTDGSISSTVSANTTSGFSIVSYTGTGSNATVGHGLSSAPKMIIFKERNGTRNWRVYHKEMGNAKVMYLNTTSAEVSDTTAFNSTSPTSSVFSVGTSGGTNASGSTYIAYCFAEKTGFSKFGTYTGNGNADGSFVYTGFKPAFVLVKRYSGIEQWQMTDSVRDKNVSPNFARLTPDTTSAEATNTTWAKIEKFSNGFKLGGTDTVSNGSGSTYIFMAFGQSLVGSNNIPATAR